MDLFSILPRNSLLEYQVPSFCCPCCNTICFMGKTLACCNKKVCRGCYLTQYQLGFTSSRASTITSPATSAPTVVSSSSSSSASPREGQATSPRSSTATRAARRCQLCDGEIADASSHGSWWSLGAKKEPAIESSELDVNDIEGRASTTTLDQEKKGWFGSSKKIAKGEDFKGKGKEAVKAEIEPLREVV